MVTVNRVAVPREMICGAGCTPYHRYSIIPEILCMIMSWSTHLSMTQPHNYTWVSYPVFVARLVVNIIISCILVFLVLVLNCNMITVSGRYMAGWHFPEHILLDVTPSCLWFEGMSRARCQLRSARQSRRCCEIDYAKREHRVKNVANRPVSRLTSLVTHHDLRTS